uniref:Uncharacterized protein n=1 Tax=Florenciella parvula TaxID=236787 RepID=A0A7S2BQ38_9STRA|mmetsp:Transcript_19065/g.39801  ORF Transcript_19065/g.39801 Transcript_19065/m.39801 type:complete len:206 (+) Transcript_19065:152-769(+)
MSMSRVLLVLAAAGCCLLKDAEAFALSRTTRSRSSSALHSQRPDGFDDAIENELDAMFGNSNGGFEEERRFAGGRDPMGGRSPMGQRPRDDGIRGPGGESMDELDAMFGGPSNGPPDAAAFSDPRRRQGRSPFGNQPPPPPANDYDDDLPNLDEMFDSGVEYKTRDDGSVVPAAFSAGNTGLSLKESMHPELYAQLFPNGEPGEQ